MNVDDFLSSCIIATVYHWPCTLELYRRHLRSAIDFTRSTLPRFPESNVESKVKDPTSNFISRFYARQLLMIAVLDDFLVHWWLMSTEIYETSDLFHYLNVNNSNENGLEKFLKTNKKTLCAMMWGFIAFWIDVIFFGIEWSCVGWDCVKLY